MSAREMTGCALFAALTATGAFIRIPVLHTVVTLQFFFTAMAGLLLGARLGALSQVLYVALGLAGLPVFAAGGGLGYLFHPTCGFVLALIPTAWVIGKAARKGSRSPARIALACAVGLVVLYAVGLPYLAWIVTVYQGNAVSVNVLTAAYMLPYLPGDLLKVSACALTAPRILRSLHGNF